MPKINFKNILKDLYQPSGQEFTLVEVPDMQFLMIDGHGDPNTVSAYQQAVESLYAVAYKLKFLSKENAQDYVVPPLEGLWWAQDREAFTTARDKSQWDWTMMIMTPDWISPALYKTALDLVREKKDLPALDIIRLESYHEGLSAQILHIGSYDQEGPTLKRLHEEWLPAQGLAPAGKHHEIYLSDPRRVGPEKLRTILRQPVAPIQRG